VTLLASVRSDLLDILEYVAKSSGRIGVAQAFVSELRAQCHKMAALEVWDGRDSNSAQTFAARHGL